MPEPATPLSERPWENIARMLGVDEALEAVLAAFGPLPAVGLPLLDAAGLVLAADVVARDPVPPFRNSAMDGYAVRAEETAGATWSNPIALPVAAQVAAGQENVPPLAPGAAIRIMTGAQLPEGANAVVRFEETTSASRPDNDDRPEVLVHRPAQVLDNVREAGEDIAQGTAIARAGQALGPADVGLLASIGQTEAPVHRRPVVAILSTGNEVAPPGSGLARGSIRDSNSYVIGALARAWGAEARLLGIAGDTVDDLTGKLGAAEDADLIVTSGGVSVGDFDLVKDVLKAEGTVGIWQVRMKPGKPLAFGRFGCTPLLGLPGNPVAAAVSFILFGRPAIRRMLGHADLAPHTTDVLAADAIDNRGQRRHYMRVRLEANPGGLPIARSVGEQGAGVLSSLAAANALLVVPEELERVAPGTRLQAITFDW